MTHPQRVGRLAVLFLGVVLCASVMEAQAPVPVACSGTQWFETGFSGPYTYYVNGGHQFEASSTVSFSGWSETAPQFAHVTYYPYPDKISQDGHMLLRQVRAEVVCWHYNVAGSSGYDTASRVTFWGVPEAYLVVADMCTDDSCSNTNGDNGGGASECWYLVRADEFGVPVTDAYGNYQILGTLGCF